MALSKIIRSIKHPKKPSTPRPVGLGDAVETLAKPIAQAIDETFGTAMVDCKGCTGTPESRKERWNKAVPDISPKGIVRKIKKLFSK